MKLPISSRRRLILFPVCHFWCSVIFWSVFLHLPVYLEDMGICGNANGFVIALFSLTAIMMAAPLGWLSDRLSPRYLCLLGNVLLIVYLLGLRGASTYWAVIAMAFVGGVGSLVYQLPLSSLYLKLIHSQTRGQRIGWFLLGVFFGYAVGGFFGGVFLQRYSMESLLLVDAALCVPLLLLTWFLQDSEPIPFHLSLYGKDLWRKEVLLLLLFVVAFGIHAGCERATITLFMKRTIELERFEIAFVFLIAGSWLAVNALFMGFVFDRYRNAYLLIVGGLSISGVTLLLTPIVVRGFRSMILLRCVHTFGDALIIFGQVAVVSLIFRRARVGGNFGVQRLVQELATFSGAYISGVLIESYDYGMAFIISGAFVLAVAAFLMFQRPIFRRMDVGRGGDDEVL